MSSPPVLLDATPLASGHGARGIGAYVRGLLAGFRELPERRRPRLLVAAGQLRPEGFECVSVRLPSWSVPRVPSPWPKIAGGRAVHRARAEVVHATGPDFVPRHAGLVATCFDLIPLRFPGEYLAGVGRAVERRAYMAYLRRLGTARIVLCPSAATAADVVTLLGLPSERVWVVPLAAPPVPTPAGVTPRAPYVLFGGGVEPHKNCALALEALRSCDPSVRLAVTGPWSPGRAARLRELARSLDVDDRVDWLGYVPTPRLSALRRGALAALVPSRLEGFGLPVLEAMVDRLPVLAADIPVLREVGGDAAIYLPLDSAPAWGAAIDGLLQSRERVAALGASGRLRAASFNWRATAERTAEAYDEARVAA